MVGRGLIEGLVEERDKWLRMRALMINLGSFLVVVKPYLYLNKIVLKKVHNTFCRKYHITPVSESQNSIAFD